MQGMTAAQEIQERIKVLRRKAESERIDAAKWAEMSREAASAAVRADALASDYEYIAGLAEPRVSPNGI